MNVGRHHTSDELECASKPIGKALRNIEAGELIQVEILPDGRLRSEAVEFYGDLREFLHSS